MAFDITATVDSLRWVLGEDSDAVASLEAATEYVAGVEMERDEAKVALSAAQAALALAQAATEELSAKIASIYKDLEDGVLDNPPEATPDPVPVDPAPVEVVA